VGTCHAPQRRRRMLLKPATAPSANGRPCHAAWVSGKSSLPSDEEHRRDAIIAFLGAGLHHPLCTAVAVNALASARRAVAAHLARGAVIDEWLASEIEVAGVRENAAVLAVIEMPEHLYATAHAYGLRHPDRLSMLNDLVIVLS
jgi:hypothetical protein